MLNNAISLQTELKNALLSFYRQCVEARCVADSAVAENPVATRFYTGGPSPFFNCVYSELLGHEALWRAERERQIAFFAARRTPFMWIVPDEAVACYGPLLLERGFTTYGSYTAVAGPLDDLPPPALPAGLTVVNPTEGAAMRHFCEVVVQAFAMPPAAVQPLALMMGHSARHGTATHYLLYDAAGTPLSALTLVLQGPIATFWNGATLPAQRRQGYSTLLRRLALADARRQGCHSASSFLMNDAMAWGICQRLGLRPAWRFTPFFWM